ncbi:MAG: tRNA (adenosine(37)-N6)-threonylcarbamoyltransferase complex dimerization subunit type 1 TsaB [Bacilli bacterium]|nr:tRNA (adenosine(37)-N6)-threonylcarbamoyltransferase complex dimerization subunit type 1 TsaB [Bacilli bacterium]
MNYFYIDTSSSYLYSGIISNNKLISEVKINFGSELSKYTVSEIQKLFKDANISPKDIDKIIVVSGPGSFTGIRIGMTFAKIFAYSMNKEITEITSLDAMAKSINSKKIIVPLIDARRGYVYAEAIKNDKTIIEPQYMKLEDLIDKLNNLNEEYIFITNDKQIKIENVIRYNPDILNIVLSYASKKSINPHLIEPTYLKLTEAEENLGTNNDN